MYEHSDSDAVNPSQVGVVGELWNPPKCPLRDATVFANSFGFPARPFILLSRYRNNIYLVFAYIPCPLRPAVEFVCAALLRTICTGMSMGRWWFGGRA